jgi:hypothetical protein
MGNETFIQGLDELYQGEVIGEVILNRMLSLFSEPEIRYKIAEDCLSPSRNSNNPITVRYFD